MKTMSFAVALVLVLTTACAEELDAPETEAQAEEALAPPQAQQGCVPLEEEFVDSCFELTLPEAYGAPGRGFYQRDSPVTGRHEVALALNITCQSLAASVVNAELLSATSGLDVQLDVPENSPILGYDPLEAARVILDPMTAGEHEAMLRLNMSNGESVDATLRFEALEPPPEEEFMGCVPFEEEPEAGGEGQPL